jgi:transcriptional regulator with XRE-family HTH domain
MINYGDTPTEMKSTRSTTVAIVRQEIGLSAEDFGKLIGKPLGTIKSLESNRLKLSEKTARVISEKTGVAMSWLLDNNVLAPPINTFGRPWTKQAFESEEGARMRENYTAFLKGGSAASKHVAQRIQEYMIMLPCRRLQAILESHRTDPEAFSILLAKVDRYLYGLEREYNVVPDIELMAMVEALAQSTDQIKKLGKDLPPADPREMAKKPPGWPFKSSPSLPSLENARRAGGRKSA